MACLRKFHNCAALSGAKWERVLVGVHRPAKWHLQKFFTAGEALWQKEPTKKSSQMDTDSLEIGHHSSGLTRVAVTGADGFLGSFITRELRAKKIEVMALGSDHPEMDCQILAPLLQNFAPTAIVHAAGPASVNLSMARPLADFRRSVGGLYELLEAARLACPEALLLFLSSAAVYGDPETLPVAETAPTRPLSPYGFHKLACELALREYFEVYGLRSVSLRIFSAYGEGLRRQLLWDVCQKALRGNFVLQGDGSQTRDFIHARSVAEAIVVLASQNGPFPPILNLASGEEVSVRQAAAWICGELGVRANPRYDGKSPAGNPQRWRGNAEMLRSFGWSPRILAEAGIRAFARWAASDLARENAA
jgi:UDP-glucose 4-epimerase